MNLSYYFIYLFIYLFICLFSCLFIYLFIYFFKFFLHFVSIFMCNILGYIFKQFRIRATSHVKGAQEILHRFSFPKRKRNYIKVLNCLHLHLQCITFSLITLFLQKQVFLKLTISFIATANLTLKRLTPPHHLYDFSETVF